MIDFESFPQRIPGDVLGLEESQARKAKLVTSLQTTVAAAHHRIYRTGNMLTQQFPAYHPWHPFPRLRSYPFTTPCLSAGLTGSHMRLLGLGFIVFSHSRDKYQAIIHVDLLAVFDTTCATVVTG